MSAGHISKLLLSQCLQHQRTDIGYLTFSFTVNYANDFNTLKKKA